MMKNAVKEILRGNVIGMPTETVYGLAGAIDSPEAINKIFSIKERPFFDPLIVHVDSIEMAKSLTTSWPKAADILANKFWPGPLTLVLPKSELVSDLITSGLPSVAIRIPNHPMALELIRKTNKPLAAPSANKFTKTSPTKKSHVDLEFQGQILTLDGGSCQVGIESSVIGIFENEIKIFRPGMITKKQLIQVIPREINISEGESSVSPGALKHHYMPRKPVTLTSTPPNKFIENVSIWEVPNSPVIAARQLYSKLREMDFEETSEIIIILKEDFKSDERFSGILNRLDKAKSTDKYFI